MVNDIKPAEERFWDQVSVTPSCWLWTGNINVYKYGSFSFNGGTVGAHRLAYEWLVGPIPKGLELDHLCRVRNCVNPAHLEPVTHKENLKRGTHNSRKKGKVDTTITELLTEIHQNMTDAAIGLELGVTGQTIWRWRHETSPVLMPKLVRAALAELLSPAGVKSES